MAKIKGNRSKEYTETFISSLKANFVLKSPERYNIMNEKVSKTAYLKRTEEETPRIERPICNMKCQQGSLTSQPFMNLIFPSNLQNWTPLILKSSFS